MRRAILLVLTLTMVLVGCGRIRESRLNPFNWFGRAAVVERAVAVEETTVAPDGRQLVSQVIDLTIEQVPGGALVRATGLPPTQGYWDAELVARPIDENGVLIYDFRVFPPPGATAVSTQQSREIIVAAHLTDRGLEQISRITVQGESNALSSAR